MAEREVLLFPDPRLKQVSAPVERFDDELKALVQDLVDTLRAHPGVGIAAPQIGEAKRVVLIDCTEKPPSNGVLVLVNPVIEAIEEMQVLRVGCMSIPAYTANVLCGRKCTVRAFDPDGNPVTIQSEGLEAVCIQHEVDHLDGILFLDRVVSLKSDVFRRKGYLLPDGSPPARVPDLSTWR